jgi:hypothetical protein
MPTPYARAAGAPNAAGNGKDQARKGHRATDLPGGFNEQLWKVQVLETPVMVNQ